MTRVRPCGNCPWRRDAPREFWDPSHFQAIAVQCRDDGISVMGCHKGGGRVCAGWLGVVGYESIGARIQAMHGGPRPEDVDMSGLDMFAGYEDMLEANRVPVPPRNAVRVYDDG